MNRPNIISTILEQEFKNLEDYSSTQILSASDSILEQFALSGFLFRLIGKLFGRSTGFILSNKLSKYLMLSLFGKLPLFSHLHKGIITLARIEISSND